jgi:hypothetical protein
MSEVLCKNKIMKFKTMPLISQLKNNIKYDAVTGLFYKYYVTKNVWQLTGSKSTNGYFVIKYKQIPYLAHRLAFYMHYGIDPLHNDVDHINRNKMDNRIVNLRMCSTSNNCMNSIKKSNNKTGYKGVCKGNGGYTAQIYLNGKKYHLGTFKTAFYAYVQYCKAAKKYHKNYKRFM